MAFKIRSAEPQDVGEIAYMIMNWAKDELPEALRIMEGTAQQAERTASLIVFMPHYTTKVMENGGGVIGGYVIMRFPEGTFGDEPYGSLLGIYVKPEHRGHRYYGLKLLMDAQSESERLGLSRLEVNPMARSRGMSSILKRMGYEPLCVTHMKRLHHV